MKVIIIGSSIAGAAMALALSDYTEVIVYESKKEEEIHKKVCGNICTYSLEKYCRELGMEEDFVVSRYNKINIFSRGNKASFPTREYEIDRKKLLQMMIEKARKNSVEFHFSTKFSGFEKQNGKYEVLLESPRKKFCDAADVLIGADGALSEVAKKAGLFKKRKFFLFLQAKIKPDDLKNKALIPEKGSYSIFLGKNHGYYSYIFPSKDGKELKIGLGDEAEKDVPIMFRLFMEKLGIKWKGRKIEGALIPMPSVIGGKNNLYLIGDASCNVKYSGGGIVPSLEQAIALRDRIMSGKFSRFDKQRRKTRINGQMTKMIQKMSDEDFDKMLEVLKEDRFKNIFSSRDDLGRKDILRILSPKLLWLGLKILARP